MIEYEHLGNLNKSFFEEYKNSFHQTLESGWYILGKNVEKFEHEFAAYCGTKHCIGLASGLDALILALDSLHLPAGSEVLVPSNTYIATILSILRNNLKPVLVEPDIATYNIDPTKIEAQITANTKAILLVHLYGKSCDMDPIIATAKKHNLVLLEDCAQAHGATYKGRKVGTFSDFGCFSFYPTKNLGALGDAGALTTNSDAVAQSMKRLRNYGSDIKYKNDVIGYNSRLDEVQAGFLSAKLKKLDEINSHKNKLATLYQENLKNDFIKPLVDKEYYHIYHIYNIRHPKRDQLKQYLLDNVIKTEIHYPIAPHKQKAMKGILDKNEFPISEEIHNTTLSLPLSYSHSEDEIYKVIEAMNKF